MKQVRSTLGRELKRFRLVRYLGFTRKELQRLYQRFQELQKKKPPDGFLSRDDLLSVREVALNPLGERLVDVIVEDYGRSIVESDRRLVHHIPLVGEANKLNFRQFAKVLSRFRRGKGASQMSTKENKLLFLFSVRTIHRSSSSRERKSVTSIVSDLRPKS